MIKKIFYWIACHIFDYHEWTSAPLEGKQLSQEQKVKGDQSHEEFLNKFFDYVKMNCKYCGKESKQSIDFRKSFEKDYYKDNKKL